MLGPDRGRRPPGVTGAADLKMAVTLGHILLPGGL